MDPTASPLYPTQAATQLEIVEQLAIRFPIFFLFMARAYGDLWHQSAGPTPPWRPSL